MICTSLIVGLHLLSYHTSPQPYMKSVTPGVYAECDGWNAGIYHNSLGGTSVHGGYTWHWEPFALTAGVASGYRTPSTLVPMLVPSVKLGFARLSFVPRTSVTKTAVLHLSIERSF